MASGKFIFVLFVLFVSAVYREGNASCVFNSDCTVNFDSYCCDGTCQFYNCIGESCFSDSDCGGDDEYCCNSVCERGVCSLSGWLVSVIVLSVLGVIGAVIGVVLCFFCSYRRHSPGLIVARPTTCAPVTTTAVVSSGSTVVQGQVAYPIVQPGAPCYGQPPPAYYPQPYN